ncbi:MAG: bifunctional 5,10-methylenetetrahydrofolate dehydrogenase/5,10-methenyltetrahydrofolate cyclohydrolase [Bacteroidales bacterium]|nr:bifunctional 5,10-methylenetetrahydrofolate dehydrogenase/5,10-methenyltetrahydrofolate cyclohydrolase [Bacteroidales bacterium]
MKIIDGKACAQQIKNQIAKEVEKINAIGFRVPKMAIMLVGDRADSVSYVRSKEKTCKSLGMDCDTYIFPENTPEQEVMDLISRLNQDCNVDAMLIQLPLPAHYDSAKILDSIDYRKDADGLHLMNVGLLHLGEPYVMPCTPKGIMSLLETNGIEVAGKHAVVIGRSQLVGEPTAQLLIRQNATVTLCHSHTNNLSQITRIADIVITAAGSPNLLKAEDFKEGAILIDVAINRTDDGLEGDVYSPRTREALEQRLSAATPVPGGVGPMTIAMLMQNVLDMYKIKNKKSLDF